jgi:hypothetical protein
MAPSADSDGFPSDGHDLVAIVDLVIDRMLDEDYVDPLERERLDLLDVSLERLLVGYTTPDLEAAERPVADRVGEVERELMVAEPAELLHQDHSQHLLPAHALSTALRTDRATLASDQIGMHPFRYLRMLVKDSAHRS